MTTAQDYQAAERLLRRPAIPGELVVGDKVNPQWIDGGTRFWYAVSNGAGPRFVLVEPATGIREPAFDPHCGPSTCCSTACTTSASAAGTSWSES